MQCNRPVNALDEQPAGECSHEDIKRVQVEGLNYIRGGLLTTWFSSLSQLKSVIEIEHYQGHTKVDTPDDANNTVYLRLCLNGHEIVSTLQSGINEDDLAHSQDGTPWDRLLIGMRSPYAVRNRVDLRRVAILGRRRSDLHGAGDVAFYDLAQATVANISTWDSVHLTQNHVGEKGYLNTFNHITAQALITSIFSEGLADFVADIHERKTMPQLITGKFTLEQLSDTVNNPVDNYVDLINNELGQELGKRLKTKYQISRETRWTPEMLSNYLNDTQSFYSWSFQVGFRPFRPEDEIVVRFALKINSLMGNIPR